MTKKINPDSLSAIGPSTDNNWRVSAKHADLTRPKNDIQALEINALPKPVTFDMAKSALIVVDMQNDFCHEDGWLAGIGVDVSAARSAIKPIASLLPYFRNQNIPVIWVNWGNRPDLKNISPALRHVYDGAGDDSGLGAELGPNNARVLEKNSWSAQVVDELKMEASDIQIDKYRMSGFWDTPLDSVLRNLRVDTLFFCGVNADQCVLHTLADANFLGYDTILIEQAATTTSPSFCMDATLYNVRQIFGFTVEASELSRALSTRSHSTERK